MIRFCRALQSVSMACSFVFLTLGALTYLNTPALAGAVPPACTGACDCTNVPPGGTCKSLNCSVNCKCNNAVCVSAVGGNTTCAQINCI